MKFSFKEFYYDILSVAFSCSNLNLEKIIPIKSQDNGLKAVQQELKYWLTVSNLS